MSEIAKVIDATESRFEKIAPPQIRYDSEKGFAIQLLRNNSYLQKVAESNPTSLQQALVNVAAIGLSLNPAKKQAYLITRSVKNGNNKWESRIFLEPSYMGMCDLATQSGRIDWIQSAVVYTEDNFVDNGPGEKPTHQYNAFSKDRGAIVGAYCVAKTTDGDYLTTLMDIEQINAVRDRSEAWKKNKSGPWKTDWIEMAKKTVVRNAFKMWPKCKEMNRLDEAVHLSNENEGFEPIQTSPEVGQINAEQKGYFDQLITNSDAIGMFVLQQTTAEAEFVSLYHSFEKGTKGKYQAIINSLLESGRNAFEDLYLGVCEVLEGDDKYALIELIEDLSEEAKGLIIQRLNAEQSQIYREMTK